VGNIRLVVDHGLADLLAAAAAGDQDAWDAIVRRFEGLLWATVRGFRLSPDASADVMQTTWLRLVEHLGGLRDPERLGVWLATTARHECLRYLKVSRRQIPVGDDELFESPRGEPPPAVDADLVRDERATTLWRAFTRIPERCQQLLRLLTADPPLPYDDVAVAIDRPIGSIGPTRARCLEQLRRALAGEGFTP
jgi:RNA polymerase sigma factor (sigma-70 family)